MSHRRGAGPVAALLEYVGFALLASIYVLALFARRRYSAIEVHNPPDFLLLAALAPRILGAPVIFDVQDLSTHMFSMRFSASRGARATERLLAIIERVSLRSADAVLTVHEPYRREVIARGARAKNTTVVMNSVEEHLLPAAMRSRTIDPKASGEFTVVYHGTLTPAYGVDLLIDAMALLAVEVQSARLEIYGEGDVLRTLRDRATQLAIRERVRFTDHYLPLKAVLRAVQSASVGVIPNPPIPLNEWALPTKLLEYVALGVPVVAADLATIRKHFDDSEILFFRAGDVNGLREALLAVARDPASAVARSRAALRRYQSYRWSLNAQRYGEALERVARK
jgi:glycosyltransferase involved in cell wall biosynthesis